MHKETTLEDVHRSLTNITPNPEGIEKIEKIRAAAKETATVIFENVTNSRERSLAFTHLEETTMWAVKAVVLQNPKEAAA